MITVVDSDDVVKPSTMGIMPGSNDKRRSTSVFLVAIVVVVGYVTVTSTIRRPCDFATSYQNSQ